MRRLIKTVYDQSGAARQIPVTRDIFTHPVDVSSLAPGASTTVAVNFENDSSFTWLKSTYTCYKDDLEYLSEGFLYVPDILVSVNDAGSSRNWMSSGVPLGTIAGVDGFPFILPEPQTYRGNSTVLFSFTNYSASVTWKSIQLALIGYKEWQ